MGVDVDEAGRDDLSGCVDGLGGIAFQRRTRPAPRRRISTILPSLTAMSASNRSAPVPSTTVPPVILRSNTITPLAALPVGYSDPIRECNTVTEASGVLRMTTHATPDVRREDAIGTPPQRPTLVPAERYYSAAFAQLEVERMWPKVWQVACTVDHVAEPGRLLRIPLRAHTRCSLFAATTAHCVPSRTCAAIAATRCVRERVRTCAS